MLKVNILSSRNMTFHIDPLSVLGIGELIAAVEDRPGSFVKIFKESINLDDSVK
jgi:hypothetical protein